MSTDTTYGPVAVTEEVAYQTPFCSLLHFKKDVPIEQPRVLMIAPMSGHFATLLRGTVRTMLADHDVYHHRSLASSGAIFRWRMGASASMNMWRT